jgi:hypothetical protein
MGEKNFESEMEIRYGIAKRSRGATWHWKKPGKIGHKNQEAVLGGSWESANCIFRTSQANERADENH